MSSVDDRIVNMQFNNKQFESNATQSMKTLNSLESTVTKLGNSKGVQGLANGIGVAQQKFSALKIAGVTAIATIANKVTLMGINMAKSLTVAPIMDGFREYQTLLSSTQTILANTGKPINQVNKALNQLNHYSDQTIYNFGQMADSIGKFTAAGVDLKTSVASIKGMANVAALSGSSVQQLNTAMYQMSQALASGTIRLQDWNSVVNAGMGGKNLQNALKISARGMGSSVDSMVKSAGSFRESLKSGWLTTKVFTNTMKAFSKGINIPVLKAQLQLQGKSAKQIADIVKAKKAQQMAQLKSLGITGKEAKEMSRMSNAAAQSASVVKTLPQLMDVTKEAIGSIWSNAFKLIFGNYNEAKKMWTAANVVISAQLNNIGKAFNRNLKEWRDPKNGGRLAVIDGFKAGFKSLGAVLGTIKTAFANVFPTNVGAGLITVSKGFNKLMQALVPSKNTLGNFEKVFGGIFSLFHIYLTITGAIRHAVIAFFQALFQGSGHANGGLMDMLGSVGALITSFDKWLSNSVNLISVFTKIGAAAGTFLRPIIGIVAALTGAFQSLIHGNIDGAVASLSKAKDILANFGGSIVKGLTTAFSSIVQFATPAAKAISKINTPLGKIGDIFDALGQKVSHLASSFRSSGLYEAGKNILLGIGRGIDDSFGEIKGSVEHIANQIVEWFKSVLGIHSPAAALVPIGQFIIAGIAKGITEAIKLVFVAIGAVGRGIIAGFKSIFTGMDPISFASMINVFLTGGLLLSLRSITKTFGGFGQDVHGLLGSAKGVFDGLTGSLKTMQTAIKAQIIKTIAISVGILAASLIALSFVKVKDLQKGLAGIASLMGLLTATVFAIAKINPKEMVSIGASLVAISSSMLLLSGAVIALGQLSYESLAKGIGSIAIVLGLLVGAMFGISKYTAGAKVSAAAMISMAVAIDLLAGAVMALGLLPVKNLARGVGAIAALMGVLVGSIVVLSKFSGTSSIAVGAMLAMALAVDMMTAAILPLALLPFDKLKQGMLAIGLAMGAMVVSLLLLSNFAPDLPLVATGLLAFSAAILGLSTSMVLLSTLSWADIAKGLTVMAAAMVLLLASAAAAAVVAPGLLVLSVTVGAFGAAALAAGAGMFLFASGLALLTAVGTAAIGIVTAAIVALIALLPSIAVQAAAAFVSFVQTVAAASPKLREAFDTIIASMLGVVQDSLPRIGDLFSELVTVVLGILTKAAPQVGKLIGTWLKVAIHTITGYYKELFDAGLGLVMYILNGIEKNMPKIVQKGANIIMAFLDGISNNIGKIADKAVNVIDKFINGLADAIQKHKQSIASGSGRLVSNLIGLGGAIIVQLGKGITDKASTALHTVINKVANFIPDWVKNILGINSPSKVMYAIGGHVVDGLANGIWAKRGMIKDAAINMAKNLAGNTIDGTKHLLGKGAGLLSKGAGLIGGILGSVDPKSVGKQLASMGDWQEAGTQIANGLADGIQKGTRVVANSADDLANATTDAFTSNMEIHSPSRKAKSWGENIALGLARGITGAKATALGAIYDLLNSINKKGDESIALASKRSIVAQKNADVAAAKAKLSQRDADRASNRSDKIQGSKKASKQDKKEARQTKNRTANQAAADARSATRLQTRADVQAQNLQAATSASQGDFNAAGDIYAERSSDLAKKAAAMLAKANAEAAKARTLRGKARQKLQKQAQLDAQSAADISSRAQKANQQAMTEYAKDVNARIQAYDQMQTESANQALFDSADANRQIEILRVRQQTDEDAANTAAALADAARKKARALIATDAIAAAKQMDIAEKQAQIAQDAAAAAKDAADQADQISKDLAAKNNSIDTRINDIEKDLSDYDATKAAEAELNNATDQGKISILQRRAAADQAASEAARQQVATLIAQAKDIQNSDPDKALAILDQADQMKDDAKSYADKAEQERNQVQDLINQISQNDNSASSGTSGPPTVIEISKSAIENAARMVDSYTASLRNAETAASSAPSVTQFVQNNNSPKALSASEIYRNTNNLLSMQKAKMGLN